ncbi:MAG: hypothetical protein DDG60_12205 [Anaerolineae bacterium]|nr:MAG: hypothetical protein DDG60_12205 [Anaerolineae bacterium]
MTINFQSLHAPRGAHAHFALGWFGGGGFALESDRAASNDVYIGWKRGSQIACFPFFRNTQSVELAGFVGEQTKTSELAIRAFQETEIERRFLLATDTWQAPHITFSIATPVSGIPSPFAGNRSSSVTRSPRPTGEGLGVRANSPRLAGERLGVRANSPLPAGEGLGVRANSPLPTGEGLGVRANSPRPAGKGLGVRANSPLPAGEGLGVRDSLLPALPARLTLDNRDSTEPLQGFFAVKGMRGLQMLTGPLTGWRTIQGTGFACRPAPNVRAVSHWDLPNLFTPPHPLPFPLADMGVLLIDVPPGETFSLDFALGWYRGGVVTDGAQQLVYAYTRHYQNIETVLDHALHLAPELWDEARAWDERLLASGLNADRQFILAQSVRSYWASTMLFDEPGAREPRLRYVVNEGSFLMLNTLDLAIDHLFYELDTQPWVVRNILDHFANEYAYHDQCGISFTHDQGSYNVFSPRGYSSYEISAQPGCYSYMTHEEVLNWTLAAALYLHKTDDRPWAEARRALFRECYRSILNRDHLDPAQRDGIPDINSSRAEGVDEITSYDSLDPSLGQTRRNLYMAVKCYAAYLALAWLFNYLGQEDQAEQARESARLCEATLTAAFDPRLGFIPALLDGVDTSPIIPAVEGLAYPHRMG